tara:strand:- start:268 stop:771 length:504 start_codon:yes stop_codon:yes gene_type:complete
MATTIRGSDNFDTAFAKSVAVIADVKAYNANGGTFTQDAWQTRDLNTELDDSENIVSITSNQFTLQAGTYLVEWAVPAYDVAHHTSRLQNITDSTTDAEGTSAYADPTGDVANTSTGAAVIAITSAKVFEVQHYCLSTKTNNGFGVTTDVTGKNNVYTLVKIHKIGA